MQEIGSFIYIILNASKNFGMGQIIICAAINTPQLISFWEYVLRQTVLYKPKRVFPYSKGE